MAENITNEGTQWVVEADIQGFFDPVNHDHLMGLLEQRSAAPCFLPILGRCLKAGVREDGRFTASEEGTPQGGLGSPVLANLYLHTVVELGFEKRVVKSCRGKAYRVRYWDGFIGCLELRN